MNHVVFVQHTFDSFFLPFPLRLSEYGKSIWGSGGLEVQNFGSRLPENRFSDQC